VSIRRITMNPRKSPASRMRRHAFCQVRSNTADCSQSVDIIAHSSHVRIFCYTGRELNDYAETSCARSTKVKNVARGRRFKNASL